MENIKRRYQNIPGYDEYSVQLQLQKDFLSQILNQEDIKIDHLGVAQDRLKDKRVFAVLDDVDHSIQLDAVAKELRWFGPVSRIIITTQDKNVLARHGIKLIYQVDFPREDEALEIFCMYAFEQKYPYYGFEKLVREVTQVPFASKLLPLRLKVMASHLKKKPIEEWKKEVPKLLKGEIESTFEICYNALRPEDKELFLYIACIFKTEQFEKVEAYLANNISDVSQGLHILVEKSLISVTDSGNIEMHDLLARLGREIDRKQSSQFLVDVGDIRKVLKNNATSRASFIGAIINFSEIKDELIKCDNAVESMSCLQFLRVNNSVQQQCTLTDWEYFLMTCLPSQFNPYRTLKQILKNLPQEVRLLHWGYFPLTSLPPKFNPEFLVELNMKSSNLRELWSGNKTIKNLRWMDLSFSENLRRLPDLSTATNLQELNLGFCQNLKKLPSSIGNAINLQKLNLQWCSSLQELPSSIGNAINLKELNIRGCLRLKELPSSLWNDINVKELDFSYCTSLIKLPSSNGNVINLQRLDLKWCSSLQELPSSIENVNNLHTLNLQECSNLRELPSSIGNAINLHTLDLEYCYNLKELPSSIGNAISLRKLIISGCTELVSLPQLPDSLETLDAEGCELLEKLHCSFPNSRFVELNFADCFKLNQEARDLITKTSTCKYAILPCEKVPPHFTYQAIGTSFSVKLDGTDTHLPTSLTFKACFLLVKKGDIWYDISDSITVVITEKQNGISVACKYDKKRAHFYNQREKKHLYTSEFEGEVSSSGLVFEFETDSKEFLIAECGISILS